MYGEKSIAEEDAQALRQTALVCFFVLLAVVILAVVIMRSQDIKKEMFKNCIQANKEIVDKVIKSDYNSDLRICSVS